MTIETLQNEYNEKHAKALEYCGDMIEAARSGNKLVESVSRAKWNRLNDEAGKIAEQISKLREDGN
jgi:hypothetical protein